MKIIKKIISNILSKFNLPKMDISDKEYEQHIKSCYGNSFYLIKSIGNKRTLKYIDKENFVLQLVKLGILEPTEEQERKIKEQEINIRKEQIKRLEEQIKELNK